MIDLSALSAVLKLAVSLGPFVVGFAGLAIHSHIAGTRHFDVMCEALQRSAGLHEELKNGGALTLKFRMMTVSAMTAGMIWPALGVRQGWLDVEDSRRFPIYLKRRMKFGMYCMFIGLGWMALVVFC